MGICTSHFFMCTYANCIGRKCLAVFLGSDMVSLKLLRVAANTENGMKHSLVSLFSTSLHIVPALPVYKFDLDYVL